MERVTPADAARAIDCHAASTDWPVAADWLEDADGCPVAAAAMRAGVYSLDGSGYGDGYGYGSGSGDGYGSG